jgi:hypothetical protein
MAVWYNLWSFGIFFTFWYVLTKENLAALAENVLVFAGESNQTFFRLSYSTSLADRREEKESFCVHRLSTCRLSSDSFFCRRRCCEQNYALKFIFKRALNR